MNKTFIDTSICSYAPDRFNGRQSVAYLVKLLHSSFNKAIDNEMTPLDLTAMQWRPLFILMKHPESTAADLARHLDIDGGAVTRMLDRLENKALITRKRSQTDRRVIHIHLTAEGKKLVDLIPKSLCSGISAHLTNLSTDELEQFKTLIHKMLDNSQKHYQNFSS